MKIGVICSAGGSAFFSAADILVKNNKCSYNDFYVVTDRNCLAEQASILRNIPHKRITQPDNDKFSMEATQWFQENKCELVLLFFTRLVTDALFGAITTLNIHPSLLPAYKGFNAIGRAMKEGVRFMGATLHVVSDLADSGPIVSQVLSPIDSTRSSEVLFKYSYIQKTYLALCAIDFIKNQYFVIKNDINVVWQRKMLNTWTSSPALQSDDLKKAFAEFQQLHNVEILLP